MLRCQDVTGAATEAMEGALPAWQALLFRLHLVICRYCRAYVRQLREVTAILRAMGRAAGSADAAVRLPPELRAALVRATRPGR